MLSLVVAVIAEDDVSGESITLNILVVMPLFISGKGEEYIFPLGIPYVSSALKSCGFSVHTLNLNHRDDHYAVLENTIKEENIDVVMSGGLSTEFPPVKKLFEVAKRCKEDVITICGGGMISGDPDATMEALGCVDYGVIGEGEVTVCELCRCLETNALVEQVEGIVFAADGQYITTPSREAISDINSIAQPDYEGFELEFYLNEHTSTLMDIDGVSRALSVLCSRSCPYQCTFCFHTVGNKYRQRSMDSIFEELDSLVANYDFDFLFVLDELFARTSERVREFCERIARYNIRWSASFRVDDITDELVQLLKDANCHSIGLGLESADNTILKSMRKKITVEQIDNALAIIRQHGLSPVGNLIFGDIAETRETASNTLEWWKNNQEYTISLKMIRTLPGSALYRHAVKNRLIKDRVQFIKDGCPYINVSSMSDADMKDLTNTISILDTEKSGSMEFFDVKPGSVIGSTDFGWECPECGNKNASRNSKLFSLSFATCSNCAFKTLPPISRDTISCIDAQMEDILKSSKIALWGMADYAMEFLNKSKAVHHDDVYLIDISTFKQGNIIAGKEVCSPDVIGNKGIDSIILLVPVFISTISSYIQERYGEKNIVNIHDLCTVE